MPIVSSQTRPRPPLSTLLLVAAAVIAIASAAVAVSRSGDEDVVAVPGPHGSAKPGEKVATVEEKIAELETKLRQEPKNPAGWRMLGWSYYETGDLMKSAGAYRKATEIEPNNAENWSSLGEALQSANTDVSAEAESAFKRAITIDRADPRARYFLAVQKDLKGNHEAAVSDWIALLKDTPPGAPWEADLRRTITQVADKQKIELAGRMPAPATGSAATAAIPGPTPEQLASASSLPPSQQSEMVQGMVERLAARLKSNPKDADGWMRLMRARMVLGDADAASEALRSGLAAFKGDAGVLNQLNRAADDLGVPRGG